tara:strand:+ start:422 stop:1081 length:660 start_codon:yes stop_codon:yes gene_type:complete
MPGYVFDKVLNLTSDEFGIQFKSMKDLYVKENGDPIEYLRELAEEEIRLNPQKILSGSGGTKRLMPGRFYLFKYNPMNKGKPNLPYYDMFPVVLVTNVYDKYFQGINFHYLPPQFRAELMNELYKYIIAPNVQSKDIGGSIRARLNTDRVNYKFMEKRYQLRSFKPAFKRYNNKHVVGRFLYVPPIGWDAVMMMPLQRFRGAGINRVYKDSLEERRRRG